MTSTNTPPVSMPDQVLCKRATVERMKAQHLRWMAQREAALSKPKPLTEQSREESLTRQHGHAANTLCRANNPPMASISFTAKAEQHVAQSAARQEMQAVTDAQKPASRKDPRPSSSTATYSKWPECKGELESEHLEHLEELDQIQDFLTAMGLQMKEIDHL